MKRIHSGLVPPVRRAAAWAFGACLLGALAVSAQETNQAAAPVSATADALRLIAQRNIFDPNRTGSHAESRSSTSSVVEAFTLVGTLTYGKGDFAFFDGTKPEYRMSLGATGVVAEFTVTGITATGVTMKAGARQLDMKVGAQLRRDGDGVWQLVPGAELPAAPGAGASAASGGEANEVLRKLMQQREQELK